MAARLTAAEVEPPVAPGDLPRVPPTPAESAAASFDVRPGFRADLVAAEPLVVDPVAMAFDADGRLYVIEMRDYSERRPERLGRVRRLEDSDGDGTMDRSTVFLDGLPWPTAITCWRGGVFVGSTPDLIYARDDDGDGRADVRETVFTGFASDYAPFATNRLNVQALMNSLQWGPDQRIHGATSLSGGRVRRVDSPFVRAWLREAGVAEDSPPAEVDLRGSDFSLDPWRLVLQAEAGGGQHGVSFGPDGDRYVCSNSDHLQWIRHDGPALPANPWHDAPAARVGIAADGPAAPVFRRSPDEPWRVLRTRWRVAGLVSGPVEGGGRPSGYFTGATGVTLYRGDAYGPEFYGNAFVADCGSNLIHRKPLRIGPDGVQPLGTRADDEAGREFLASTDTWFRPVQFINAPDGCLWVADMYREVIEHPWSLPDGIKSQLDLNSGNDRGRIWRLAPEGFRPAPGRTGWTSGDLPGLIARLGHPDGWHRDTAGRLLVERRDPAAPVRLRDVLRNGSTAAARSGSLAVLAALDSLGADDVVAGLGDADPSVRRRTLAILRRVPDVLTSESVRESMRRLAVGESDARVRHELIQTAALLPVEDRVEVLAPHLATGPAWLRSLAIHAAGPAAGRLALRVRSGGPAVPVDTWAELAGVVGRQADGPTVTAWVRGLDPVADPLRALVGARALWDGLDPAGRGRIDDAVRSGLAPVTAVARRALATGPGEAIARAGLEWLARVDPESVGSILPDWLQAAESAPAALAALERVSGTAAARWEPLLAAWNRYPSDVRSRLTALARRRVEGVDALLGGLESGRLRAADLAAVDRQALQNHSDAARRDRARAVLGDPIAGRAGVIADHLAALGRSGDPSVGHGIFRERCASCHARSGEGVAVGPDLASVASNGPEKLLVAILDPHREVAPAFAAWRIETVDGETVDGLRVRETDAGVTLRQAGGAEVSVERARIRRFDSDGRSLMPEGLEAGLGVEGVAALLAWLQLPPGAGGIGGGEGN